MQTEETTVQEQLQFRVYRPYNVVMGNRTPSINEKNKKYKLLHGNKGDYKIWKEYFMKDYEVDVTRKIITEVKDGIFLDISLGDILHIGETYKNLGEHIKSIIMKACYTGQDYRVDLRNFIMFHLEYGTDKLYEDLVHN